MIEKSKFRFVPAFYFSPICACQLQSFCAGNSGRQPEALRMLKLDHAFASFSFPEPSFLLVTWSAKLVMVRETEWLWGREWHLPVVDPVIPVEDLKQSCNTNTNKRMLPISMVRSDPRSESSCKTFFNQFTPRHGCFTYF